MNIKNRLKRLYEVYICKYPLNETDDVDLMTLPEAREESKKINGFICVAINHHHKVYMDNGKIYWKSLITGKEYSIDESKSTK